MEFALEVDAKLRGLPGRQEGRGTLPDGCKTIFEAGRKLLREGVDLRLVAMQRQHARQRVIEHVGIARAVHRRMKRFRASRRSVLCMSRLRHMLSSFVQWVLDAEGRCL